ncbi:hypothetical protein KSP40_PGU017751 [Platanthera guangdongensis]|uniref:Uncharacterized protein n=1 Tax=Platanthera guangdongensis TaxID=2320717 RepID=A0ABR2LC85_9ASPA
MAALSKWTWIQFTKSWVISSLHLWGNCWDGESHSSSCSRSWRRWQPYGEFQLIMLITDVFTCMFQSAEALVGILMGGPWYINEFINVLDVWSSAFSSSPLTRLSSPLWVRLPSVETENSVSVEFTLGERVIAHLLLSCEPND